MNFCWILNAKIWPAPLGNHRDVIMFAALWLVDPKFNAIKDLNLLKKHTKNQEASSILRVDFALSKWPHLHRASLVTICNRTLKAYLINIYALISVCSKGRNVRMISETTHFSQKSWLKVKDVGEHTIGYSDSVFPTNKGL